MSPLYLNGLDSNDLKSIFKEAIREFYESKETLVVKEESRFLNRKEVCQILGITLPTLHIWCKAGKITSYRIGTRVRFKRDEVNSALIRIKG